MKRLQALGLVQGFLPPHERPHLPTLRALGFSGSAATALQRAARRAPHLLALCASASPMWAANAATVSPSADTIDNRVHFTPANLASMPHRSLESGFTGRVLRRIFEDERYFVHHPPIPAAATFGDEGAANHSRLCNEHGDAAVQLFVYGHRAYGDKAGGPTHYPARQALEASEAVARSHGVDPGKTVFARQNAAAIDAGAFHNDVVAVVNRNVLFIHEQALAEPYGVLQRLSHHAGNLHVVRVSAAEVSLQEAVTSYLFNSQLIDVPGRTGMTLVLPTESQENPRVLAALERIRASDNPIDHLDFVDVRQSMHNGGGPACLRLRIVLSESELAAVNPSFLLTDQRYRELCDWVDRHYREELLPADLADPALVEEGYTALDELTAMLGTGALYDFQLN